MQPPTAPFLFVYGTLRHGCDNQYSRRLMQESRYIGPAFAPGALYRIANPHGPDYPAMIPDKDGGQISGDIFQLHSTDQTWPWLDAYEECSPDFPSPQEYRRTVLTAQSHHRVIPVWAYVYNWPVGTAPRLLSGDWLREMMGRGDDKTALSP